MKVINATIRLRQDSLKNWEKSEEILLAGEPVVAFIGNGPPRIKIGDGEKCFRELPYAAAEPDTINAFSVDLMVLESITVNGTINSSGKRIEL